MASTSVPVSILWAINSKVNEVSQRYLDQSGSSTASLGFRQSVRPETSTWRQKRDSDGYGYDR
jgi:hypothetical protein